MLKEVKYVCFRSSFSKMAKILVKYFAESEFGQEPKQATIESAGYDLFAAEAKTILHHQSALVSLDLRWAIPKGFCGRVFSRSSLIRESNITVEGGLIDSDFREIINVILINHSPKPFTVRTGERLARVVFMQRFDVEFVKVNQSDELGLTERNEGGFGSTGKTAIKKLRLDEDDDNVITSEEAILSEGEKVIVHEKVKRK